MSTRRSYPKMTALPPLPSLRPTPARRRLGVRLALFALLVAALVPTFSRLVQPVGLAEWVALCRPAADVRPAGPSSAATRPDTPPAGDHDHGDACALCSIAHTTPVLGTAAGLAVAVLAYAPPVPLAPVAVRTRVAQSRAPGARGPPVRA